jgi:hypothetical protein
VRSFSPFIKAGCSVPEEVPVLEKGLAQASGRGEPETARGVGVEETSDRYWDSAVHQSPQSPDE